MVVECRKYVLKANIRQNSLFYSLFCYHMELLRQLQNFWLNSVELVIRIIKYFW